MAAATICDLTNEEIRTLMYVRSLYPNRWKCMIREAWRTGDYSPLSLRESQDQVLQHLRNSRGPSWLVSLKFPI